MTTSIEIKDLRRALVTAGLEVFRVKGDEVHLAERHNVQLMEAGVRVRAGADPTVSVVLRAQRNDAPTLGDDRMYAAVRERAQGLRALGYSEVSASAREIRSVSDGELLDVWFEVTVAIAVASLDDAVSKAVAAFATERYVVP